MKNIVLIGMRGSGKSTIGRALAHLLQRKFIDLDKVIEKEANMKISDIVAKHGWEHFRDLESKAVQEYASSKNIIIATGGGAILRDNNTNALKKNGTLVFLSANSNVLAERIKNCTKRPSLTNKNIEDEIEEIWQNRQNKYTQAADIIIDVSKQSCDFTKDANSKAASIITQLKIS